MKFLYGLHGANIPVIREFDIASKTKIQAGMIVRCSADGIVSPNSIGNCIGVAAEDHSGEKDILNERSNGTKVRVDITGGGVYSVPAPKFTSSQAGTATTFICENTDANSSPIGSSLMLVAKGGNSTNTDSVGTMRKIWNVTVASGKTTMTLENGGASCEGDVYALIPYCGFKGNVANDNKNFTTSSGTGVSLTVIGYDEKTACLEVLLGAKLFN